MMELFSHLNDEELLNLLDVSTTLSFDEFSKLDYQFNSEYFTFDSNSLEYNKSFTYFITHI